MGSLLEFLLPGECPVSLCSLCEAPVCVQLSKPLQLLLMIPFEYWFMYQNNQTPLSSFSGLYFLMPYEPFKKCEL
jgi:hypothetical protein